MKKVMFVLAVAGMFAFAACNNQNAEAPAEDTTAAQTEEVAPEATEEQAETEATDAEAEATEGVAEEAAAEVK